MSAVIVLGHLSIGIKTSNGLSVMRFLGRLASSPYAKVIGSIHVDFQFDACAIDLIVTEKHGSTLVECAQAMERHLDESFPPVDGARCFQVIPMDMNVKHNDGMPNLQVLE